jgi:hypothetical protein
MASPSQAPVRYPNGLSTDNPFGPLANYGNPHPFAYHVLAEDFNVILDQYVQTKTSAGTILLAAGDGGKALFTTNATTPLATDICSMQIGWDGFKVTAGKKMHFLARIQLSDAVNAAFIVGMIQVTTTPFTVTDGIYFQKASGSSQIALKSAVGSAITTLNLPTTAYNLANNTDIDLGFYMDRNGTIYAYAGANLINVQASNAPAGQVKGSIGSFAPTLTAAGMNPTLAIQSGTASSKTMAADFIMAAKER